MSIEDIIFEKSYQETLNLLESRSMDETFDIESIKEELNNQYIYEGLDWTGRGEIKNSEISGSISAYQVFINQYLKNKAVINQKS